MISGPLFTPHLTPKGKPTKGYVYSLVCLLAVSSIAGQAIALKPALQAGQEGDGLEWHREGLSPAALLVEPRMPEVPVFILRLIDNVRGAAGLQGAAATAQQVAQPSRCGFISSSGVQGQHSVRLYDLLHVYRL